MTDTKNTTEKIYEQNGFVAYVMGVNGPKASGHGEAESEAWDACADDAGPLDIANIIVKPKYTCTLPDLGPAWNNKGLNLNQQGCDWEGADEDPEKWPVDAIGFYHNIYTGNPAIFLTGLGAEGAWTDPDNNGAPVCLECIRAGGAESVEGEDDPADFLDADDYENGETDESYKRELANFQFHYKKLETPGECWSCLQMITENTADYYEEV